jgi:hypothetical protein
MAIVVTVHSNGSVNLVYGEPYSDEADGIWPVANAANVPRDRFEPLDDQSVGDAPTPGDGGTGGGDVGTQGDVVIKDFDNPESFADRTPVSDVAQDIRSGDYDDVLDVIEAAERAGRDRDTVYDAIESRR